MVDIDGILDTSEEAFVETVRKDGIGILGPNPYKFIHVLVRNSAFAVLLSFSESFWRGYFKSPESKGLLYIVPLQYRV